MWIISIQHLVVTGLSETIGLFTKEVNLRLAKRPLKTNGCLANCGLTSLVKEATYELLS